MATTSPGQVRPSIWWLVGSGGLVLVVLVFLVLSDGGRRKDSPSPVASSSQSVVAPAPAELVAPSAALEASPPQAVNVAAETNSPPPAQAPSLPKPVKSPHAAALASELLPRYKELKQHLALVEAKRKEILERDPDLANINKEKMREMMVPNAAVALAQAAKDPVYRTIFEDVLQDPHDFEELREMAGKLAASSNLNLPIKEARSPQELLSFIQQASPALQARRDTLYQKLGMNEEMATVVEDGVSTGMMSSVIEHYLLDAGWRFDSPENLNLVPPAAAGP